MSHIVQIETEVRDPVAVTAACARLRLPVPSRRTVRLYHAEATGLAVELPRWRFPVVCQTETGQVRYDNFGGRWGDPSELDRLLQIYAVEKTRLEARKQGHDVVEQALADGSIRLTIQVGGGL